MRRSPSLIAACTERAAHPLHAAVIEHTRLGTQLLGETDGVTHTILATALAEALLLAGRIEFFDLRQPDDADATLMRRCRPPGKPTTRCSGGDPGTRGVRAWLVRTLRRSRRPDARSPRLRPPRSGLRRVLGLAGRRRGRMRDLGGQTREALQLINHAEDGPGRRQRARLAGMVRLVLPHPPGRFKGNTQLHAGHLPQASQTLIAALDDATTADDKQRTVILGDLAAVEAAQRNPEAACDYAEQALDQLAVTWYATGMDRVLDVRRALQPWAEQECVQPLDDQLYGWKTTLIALGVDRGDPAGKLDSESIRIVGTRSASGSSCWIVPRGHGGSTPSEAP